VLVFVGIVDDGFFLDALLGYGASEMDEAIGGGVSGEDADFQGVEAFAGVAIGGEGEMAEGVVIGLDGA
jgi:hypothetical protein